MKYFIKNILSLVCALLLLGATILPPEKCTIEILQYGKPIEVQNTIVALEKDSFQIRITLKNQDGVFMNASFNSDYYDTKNHEKIKDYEWLGSKVMAESNFNANRQLFIHDENLSYLFYDPNKNWHRFDKDVIVHKKEVIATKSVQYFYDGETMPIKNINKPVYLFFFATKKWRGKHTPKELGRLKLKLVWK
ncbi:MAG: hypothetical protein EAY81_05165 [Bacteroidetes bacterium]|nr:MAG: hypothetical protein EAY81_05165 [Bacteroidota bacterium]